jgi:hypothetical protein
MAGGKAPMGLKFCLSPTKEQQVSVEMLWDSWLKEKLLEAS